VFISENGGDLRLWEIGEPDLATTCIPGSNTRGTARELGRFYEALLRDGRSHSIGPNLKTLPTESPESQDHPTKNLSDKPRRLLKPETVAELIRPQRVGLFDETFQHVIDFGLGVVLNSNRYGSGTVPYGFGPVASDKAFGHGGSQSSIAFADPERDLVVVVICNGRPGEGRHQRRMRQILEALEEDLQNTDGELFFG
jgi:CubicO group peptidase (beta-lactamase class C family)